MAKDKKCNGCKYLELTMAIDSYFATCNKGFFKNRKHISTLCSSPVDKPSKCKSFMSKNPKPLHVNFKPKKHQYIYVARDKIRWDNKCHYRCSDNKMFLDKYGYYIECYFGTSQKPFFGIELKKGEQVRIPILIDKAEVVK